jgi:hypothetical protein
MKANNAKLRLSIKPDSSGSMNGTPRLALRPKEAAAALGIGERLLWLATNRGEVPHVRLGKAILYPIDGLRRWLAEQERSQG